VVAQRGEVTRALDIAADELARRHLVKRAPTAREQPRVGHQILDHRSLF
jgi:hypothetical protein